MEFFTAELFEMFMVICFGFAWPTSILKSIKAKTARGKSLVFMIVVWVGYGFGICSKLVADNLTYVLIFYIINIIMVSVDLVIYFINRRKDRKEPCVPISPAH